MAHSVQKKPTRKPYSVRTGKGWLPGSQSGTCCESCHSSPEQPASRWISRCLPHPHQSGDQQWWTAWGVEWGYHYSSSKIGESIGWEFHCQFISVNFIITMKGIITVKITALVIVWHQTTTTIIMSLVHPLLKDSKNKVITVAIGASTVYYNINRKLCEWHHSSEQLASSSSPQWKCVPHPH